MQRMEWEEAGDWEIYYNYLILSPAATVTFYGTFIIFQAEHLHSFLFHPWPPALCDEYIYSQLPERCKEVKELARSHDIGNFCSWNSTSGVCPTPRPVPSCCPWSMNRWRRESYPWDPGHWWGLCCPLRALMTRAFLPDPQPHSWLPGPAHLGWPCHTLSTHSINTHIHTHSTVFWLEILFC